jgi:hypothetical protein
MNQIQVLEQVNAVLRLHCDSPIKEMRKMGQALIGIADALDGRSVAEARAIIEAVQQLQSVRHD